MTNFRFLHAADIHLDSPLRGLDGQEGEIARQIRSAPREAFEQLIERALHERVDFVVIAGDLYDGDWRDYRTGLFFVAQMGRLHAAGIPVFLLYGNHDAESRITKALDLPSNVRVFPGSAPRTFTLDDIGVALHGQSFPEKAVTANLVPEYPSPRRGMFNIGVLHTGLGGMDGHDNYAPCSLMELTAKGYEYWALGHIHRRRVLNRNPWVVFPGNLQGRHVRETGAKGAALVTVRDGDAELDWLDLDVVRWETVAVPVAGVEDFEGIVDAIQEAVESAAAVAGERLLVCRIRLEGRTSMHGRLHAEAERLLAEARSAVLGLGDRIGWVARVDVETTPRMRQEALAARADAVGDLTRMLAEAPADPGLLEQLEQDLQALVARTPSGVADTVEDAPLRRALDRDYPGLIRETTPWLLAHLSQEDD